MNENAKKDAIKRYDDIANPSYSIHTVKADAKQIRQYVADGIVTWDELGFTDDDVEARLNAAKVKDAIKRYDDIANPSYSVHTAKADAKQIRQYVADGIVIWDELGFTDDDVEARLNAAKVKDAIKRYDDIANPAYTVGVAKTDAKQIRQYVADGIVTWDELGFTDDDVKARLNAVRER